MGKFLQQAAGQRSLSPRMVQLPHTSSHNKYAPVHPLPPSSLPSQSFNAAYKVEEEEGAEWTLQEEEEEGMLDEEEEVDQENIDPMNNSSTDEQMKERTAELLAAPVKAAPTSSAAAPTRSSSSSSSSTPPSTAAVVTSTLRTIALPVGYAAKTVFHLWVGAMGAGVGVMSSGVRRALQLRRDWVEGQGARKKLAVMRQQRAEERARSKKREQMAMQRLQQLEQQIQSMREQLMSQTPQVVPVHSPCCHVPLTAAPRTPLSPGQQRQPQQQMCIGWEGANSVPTAPPLTQPVAPPLTTTSTTAAAASFIPIAPPLAPTSVPIAPPLSSSAPAAPKLTKPDASALQAAASKLRATKQPTAASTSAASSSSSSSSTKPAASAASSSSSGINLDMLKQVKLKQVQPPSSTARPRRPSLSAAHPSMQSFLQQALNAKFQRSAVSSSSLPRRVSVGGGFRSLSAHGVLATPLHTRPVFSHASSAFSPMTPASEEPWTPAH